FGDEETALCVWSDAARQQPSDAAVLEHDLGRGDVLVLTTVEGLTGGADGDRLLRDQAQDDVDVVDHQVEDDADVLDASGGHEAPRLEQVRLAHLALEHLDRLVEARDVTDLEHEVAVARDAG